MTIPEVFVFITFTKHNLRSARFQLASLIFTEDIKVAREIHLQVRFVNVVISAENGKYRYYQTYSHKSILISVNKSIKTAQCQANIELDGLAIQKSTKRDEIQQSVQIIWS